jgi:Ser/Thr protein kinase RdoA (MazF antagonist)
MKIPLCLIALLCLSSCNFLEALHQTAPGYHKPLPFSEPWWDKRRGEKAQRWTKYLRNQTNQTP